jgi:hypothetical protein
MGGTGPDSIPLGFADQIYFSDSTGKAATPIASRIYNPVPQAGPMRSTVAESSLLGSVSCRERTPLAAKRAWAGSANEATLNLRPRRSASFALAVNKETDCPAVLRTHDGNALKRVMTIHGQWKRRSARTCQRYNFPKLAERCDSPNDETRTDGGCPADRVKMTEAVSIAWRWRPRSMNSRRLHGESRGSIPLGRSHEIRRSVCPGFG